MVQNKKINQLKIYTDGGSRGNPGPAAIGVYATVDNQPLFQLSQHIGNTTNNVAEWQAVIKALEYLISNDIQVTQLDFFLDSELVVKQIKGEYKVKQPHLQLLSTHVSQLLQQLKTSQINFYHVPRNQNQIADSLVNQALDILLK